MWSIIVINREDHCDGRVTVIEKEKNKKIVSGIIVYRALDNEVCAVYQDESYLFDVKDLVVIQDEVNQYFFAICNKEIFQERGLNKT